MPIAATVATSAADTVNRQTYTTASVTAEADTLYILHVVGGASTNPGTPTVTGLGVTFTADQSVLRDGSTDTRSLAYSFAVTAQTAGTISIDWGATIERCTWVLLKLTGTPPTKALAVVQSASAGGASGTGASVSLAAFAGVLNAAVGLFTLHNSTDITPGSGFTQLAEPNTGENTMSMQEWAINDASVDATWSTASSQYAVIAYEIQHRHQVAVSGAITPTGTLAKTTSKTLLGAITPTGTLATLITRVVLLAGSITPTGTLAKSVTKTLAGSITPTGTLTVSLLKQFLYPLATATLNLIARATDALHLTSQSEDTLHLDPLEEDDR